MKQGDKKRIAVLILCGAVLAAAVGFAVHAGVTSGADNEIAVTEETVPVSGSAVLEEDLPETVIEPEEPAYEPASLSLIAVGDNLIHGTLLKDSSNGDGTYDFTPFYEDIKPYVEEKFQSWIIGTADFEADYDKFVSELHARGIDEAIAINQKAYDYYMSAGK